MGTAMGFRARRYGGAGGLDPERAVTEPRCAHSPLHGGAAALRRGFVHDFGPRLRPWQFTSHLLLPSTLGPGSSFVEGASADDHRRGTAHARLLRYRRWRRFGAG